MKRILILFVAATLIAGCQQICSYVPIPGVCAAPSATSTPTDTPVVTATPTPSPQATSTVTPSPSSSPTP